jgi:hypothetical protein
MLIGHLEKAGGIIGKSKNTMPFDTHVERIYISQDTTGISWESEVADERTDNASDEVGFVQCLSLIHRARDVSAYVIIYHMSTTTVLTVQQIMKRSPMVDYMYI